ncbi:MAG: hypothetical protein EA398_06640 [Deltaproteobacteria bacterium]|nr:MAG: hypothetical protein EA398_06640 [Deltaproteobacteria bacterium]
MDIEKLKARALEKAMKIAQSDSAQQIMADERFQRAFAQVFESSMKARDSIEKTRRDLAHRFNLATEDDLRDMKRKLERLERRLERQQEGGKPRRGRPSRSEAAPPGEDEDA